MTDQELLALHRELVAIPSVSGNEDVLCGFLLGWLRQRGLEAHRVGNSLYALSPGNNSGRPAPVLCLNSHLDTVPPGTSWTREPHRPVVENGRVYGLGSNDAKASVAAMIATLVRLHAAPPQGLRVVLALSAQEETNGKGTESLLPVLKEQGLSPAFAIVGEPTELDIAIAQKGLLVLELQGKGEACHAAHRKKLGKPNAIRNLAASLGVLDRALENSPLSVPHPLLGEITLEPTVISGGTARNMNPAEASCYVDMRINPDTGAEEVLNQIRPHLPPGSELRVHSDRLKPFEVSSENALVHAALGSARALKPDARTFGSRGLSDLVYFRGIPAIKAGPGVSERSHTPDEYVLEQEILDGATFYEKTILQLSKGL